MSRRLSTASVLDTSGLLGYYNRRDVFVSFTDDGEYDMVGAVENSIRPYGVFGYMVNDVVGRHSRQTTLYGRVFRYNGKNEMDVAQYTMGDFNLDYEKVIRNFPLFAEEIEEEFVLTPGRVGSRNAAQYLLSFTFRVAVLTSSGRSGIPAAWASVLKSVLGYDSVVDRVGRTNPSGQTRAYILVLLDQTNVEDLEVVSTQRHKKEINNRIANKIERLNNSTKVSNSRRRIKKWQN